MYPRISVNCSNIYVSRPWGPVEFTASNDQQTVFLLAQQVVVELKSLARYLVEIIVDSHKPVPLDGQKSWPTFKASFVITNGNKDDEDIKIEVDGIVHLNDRPHWKDWDIPAMSQDIATRIRAKVAEAARNFDYSADRIRTALGPDAESLPEVV